MKSRSAPAQRYAGGGGDIGAQIRSFVIAGTHLSTDRFRRGRPGMGALALENHDERKKGGNTKMAIVL